MTFARRTGVLAAFALAIAIIVWPRSYADPPPTRDVPPQVIANAQIAQANMQRIVQAIAVYQNEHRVPPPKLSSLYPQWIDDPRVFWHPGDADPPPTSIDNDVPNGVNSAQISFQANLPLFEWSACRGEQSLMHDNTASNNDGFFVIEYRHTGFETNPPDMLPTPTPSTVARARLRSLVMGIRIYSNDNWDWWPTDPIQLARWVGPPCDPARVFWHPGDNKPMPTQITNSVLNATDSAQISFEYLVAGLTESDADPNLPAFRDNSPANNGGCGRWIALLSGDSYFEWICVGDLTGDGAVNWADYERLAQNFGAPRDPCQGDINDDREVNLADFALLQRRFGATCP
jgi:hypothetical protein